MTPKGAYLDGNVYNIHSLNKLFNEDKKAFSHIILDELIDYQERLEEAGIDYGFNQDMVDFANQHCRTVEKANADNENLLPPVIDEIDDLIDD